MEILTILFVCAIGAALYVAVMENLDQKARERQKLLHGYTMEIAVSTGPQNFLDAGLTHYTATISGNGWDQEKMYNLAKDMDEAEKFFTKSLLRMAQLEANRRRVVNFQ